MKMKIASTGVITAAAAALLVLANLLRGPDVPAQPAALPIDHPSDASSQPALAAMSAPLEGDAPSPPQAGTGLPSSGPAGSDAPPSASPAPPSVPPGPPRPEGRAAYLQELVAQARQQNDQLAEIQDQLAARQQQAAEKESERQAQAQEESAQHAATLRALDILRRAEAMLAFGNSDGVDDELANASTALWGRTRLDVEAAREALANEDLFLAREYLTAALAERRPLY